MITHERFCPQCDRTLTCADFLHNVGILVSGGNLYCPQCRIEYELDITEREDRFPAPLCGECSQHRNHAAFLVELPGMWERDLRRVNLTSTIHYRGGVFQIYCGRELTTAITIPPCGTARVATVRTPRNGELPCGCNNCVRRRTW